MGRQQGVMPGLQRLQLKRQGLRLRLRPRRQWGSRRSSSQQRWTLTGPPWRQLGPHKQHRQMLPRKVWQD